MAAPPPMRLSEWAETNFYLSAESSYRQERWSAYPYQVALLDCMGSDEIEEVNFRKSARVGYTKMLLAAVGYFAEHKRRNQAVWLPTDEDRDGFVKTELEPMLRDVSVMRDVFPQQLAKNKSNTLKQKTFIGSTLHLRGGKAAKNYRALSVDVAYLDELDGFDTDIEKEGSPVTLSSKRVEGATFPKKIRGTTPKLKGFSMIEACEENSDVNLRRYVPCTHCREEIMLEFGGKDKPFGFKFDPKEPETVRHLCQHCGGLMSQADYLREWQRGRWLDRDKGVWISDADGKFRNVDGEVIPAPRSVGFHVWTAYSPMTTWAQIVREFLAASEKAKTGDKAELKTFVNTTLGETWEEEVEQTDEAELRKRVESYALRTVPKGCLVLAAGVDLQDNRFELTVWGFGRGEEMWLIDYVILAANPADERDWDKLDGYLQSKFRHHSGQLLGIDAVAVDTGGHFTHQAYNFCRVRANRRVFAVKGESRSGRPIKSKSSSQDVNHRGKIIKAGVKLWLVGTDTAKDLLHGRLKVTQPGPGYVHFPKGLPDDFFVQLTNEVRVLQRTHSGEQFKWVKKKSGARNEALDTTVYAMFAAQMLDLHRYTDRMWARLEAAVQPANADMFMDGAAEPDDESGLAPTDAVIAQSKAKQPRKRRQSFSVNSW